MLYKHPLELQWIQRPEGNEIRSYRLQELPDGEYVNTVGRVVKVRCREKEDDLGSKPCIFGILEDSTFKVPFISYRPIQLFNGTVHGFEGVYSHRFKDGSYLLVLTEHSKVRYLDDEKPEDYVWAPRIGSIIRPTGFLAIPLKGTVTEIYGGSGLVKRCNECGRVLFQDACPSGHDQGSYWSVRVSALLSDETGSIRIILGQQLTCRLLGIPISAIMLLATAGNAAAMEGFKVEAFSVEPPRTLGIREAIVEDPGIFRSRRHLIVTDFGRSRIYCLPDLRISSSQILSHKERILDFSKKVDRWLMLTIFRKALEACIAEESGLPELHGIQLLEEPIPLYGVERARLYLGFELRVSENEGKILVEAYPQAYIRESVLDYVAWRRRRGASAKSIEKALMKWRSKVLCAPNGMRGRIVKVLFKDAGEILIPDQNRSLPEFWSDVYGLKVDPGERPCLIVKPYSINIELTYPPSMVFFDFDFDSDFDSGPEFGPKRGPWLRKSVKAFIDAKRRSLNLRVRKEVLKALGRLEIGEYKPRLIEDAGQRVDAGRLVSQKIKERLLGKALSAYGSLLQIGGRLYFFPRILLEGN